jgi:trans-2,3-dihydro-3-hydroxyanthranilate isomerase
MPEDYEFVICDVFTDRPLTGNQLAVFVDAAEIPDGLLQALAREVNFSETTFVYPPDDPNEADARVRIFTPEAELPFAGHPVLGTAVVVGEARGLASVRLLTGAGVVPVDLDGRSGRMIQPIPAIVRVPEEEVDEVVAALGGVQPRLPVDRYDNGVRHQIVIVDSVDTVLGARPDFSALARVARDAGTTLAAGEGTRWTSRMFAPGLGVAEDPATGSAAGPLVTHLCRQHVVPWGTEIEIFQGEVIQRPSVLRAVSYGSDDGIERVEVAGDAVPVGRGTFTL